MHGGTDAGLEAVKISKLVGEFQKRMDASEGRYLRAYAPSCPSYLLMPLSLVPVIVLVIDFQRGIVIEIP